MDGQTTNHRDDDTPGTRRFVPFPTLGQVVSGQVSLHDEGTKFGVATYVRVDSDDGESLYILEEEKP